MPPGAQREEARIKAVYAGRRNGDLYSWMNPAYVFAIQQRERAVLRLLRRMGLRDLSGTKVFEVGCGTGQWLRDFLKWGARPENLAGIDLLNDRVDAARTCSPSGIRFCCGSATRLDCPDAGFDLVLQSTVFTSVLDDGVKRQMAREMCRILKPGGFILWYDYHVNNPRNPDVRGVTRREIQDLFSGCRVVLQRITLAPPITRALIPYSHLLCCALECLPPLCTHYLGCIEKRRRICKS